MLTGFISIALANRDLVAVLTGDPSVGQLLLEKPDWGATVQRQLDLLAGPEPGARGRIRASIVMSGISGAIGVDYTGAEQNELADELIAAGRRTLGLRLPRN